MLSFKRDLYFLKPFNPHDPLYVVRLFVGPVPNLV